MDVDVSSINGSNSDVYNELVSTYEDSVSKVNELAWLSIQDIQIPLLPPFFSKNEIITCLRNVKRKNKYLNSIESRMSIVVMVTDYVITAILSLELVDLFCDDVNDKSKTYIMNLLSKEWEAIFTSINTGRSHTSSKVIITIHKFLVRMYESLKSSPRYKVLATKLISLDCSLCFWRYCLKSIDGKDSSNSSFVQSRENPIKIKIAKEVETSKSKVPSAEEGASIISSGKNANDVFPCSQNRLLSNKIKKQSVIERFFSTQASYKPILPKPKQIESKKNTDSDSEDPYH